MNTSPLRNHHDIANISTVASPISTPPSRLHRHFVSPRFTAVVSAACCSASSFQVDDIDDADDAADTTIVCSHEHASPLPPSRCSSLRQHPSHNTLHSLDYSRRESRSSSPATDVAPLCSSAPSFRHPEQLSLRLPGRHRPLLYETTPHIAPVAVGHSRAIVASSDYDTLTILFAPATRDRRMSQLNVFVTPYCDLVEARRAGSVGGALSKR